MKLKFILTLNLKFIKKLIYFFYKCIYLKFLSSLIFTFLFIGCFNNNNNSNLSFFILLKNWTLFWNDEFENSLNEIYWTIETGGNGWGNNELQYYTNRIENVKVENGYLNIIARKEYYNGKNYTSGRIKTQNKIYNTYGKIESRIKLSSIGQGLWPAFWLLGNNISQVGWPKCGEIDIMEHINTTKKVVSTIHYDDGNTHKYSTGEISNIDITEWHIYAIEWNSHEIKWFIDGREFHYENIDLFSSREEFHQPFFIILNIAIGGNWPGFVVDDNMFPVIMYVDWIRWYK